MLGLQDPAVITEGTELPLNNLLQDHELMESEEGSGLGAFGLHSKHPIITQHHLIHLYKIAVDYAMTAAPHQASTSQTQARIDLEKQWQQFQQHFAVKPVTEVITKSQAGKFLIFLCPENILNLITPNINGKYSIPAELMGAIMSQLTDPSLFLFVVYQGKVANQIISLKKILSTNEDDPSSFPCQIIFPRYLLLDDNFLVLSLSDSSGGSEYFSRLAKEVRSRPFSDLNLLPNSFLPITSNVFKFFDLIRSNLGQENGGEGGEVGALLSLQDTLLSLYDEHWMTYLLLLLKFEADKSLYYFKLFIQIVSGILLLPKLRSLPQLVERVVETMVTLDYLMPVLRQSFEMTFTHESLSLVILCLQCAGRLCQFSEKFAAFLVTEGISRIFFQVINQILSLPQPGGDRAISALLRAMKLVILNSPERQLLFIDSGLNDCLDRCLLKYESLVRREVILLSQSLQSGSIHPRIYLPPWLLVPFTDSSPQCFENLISDLECSKEKEATTLANALQRSRQFGISSLIISEQNQLSTRQSKPAAVRITNDFVFSRTHSIASDEELSNNGTDIETSRQLYSQFVETVESPKWLYDYWAYLAASVASSCRPDEPVRCYLGDTGVRTIGAMSQPPWKFVFSKIDYFSLAEPLFEDEDFTSDHQILIRKDDGLPFDCSMTSGSAWKALPPSSWHIIRDDTYVQTEHTACNSLTKIAPKMISIIADKFHRSGWRNAISVRIVSFFSVSLFFS
jgi:hypothetical protein